MRAEYARAKGWVEEHAGEPEGTRLRARLLLEARLLAVCRPYLSDDAAPQAVPRRRIERHLEELFVLAGEPGVPPDNNAAERSLRPLVTARKVSGGTRSRAGTETKMALAPAFGTRAARGLDPYRACLELLGSPQP